MGQFLAPGLGQQLVNCYARKMARWCGSDITPWAGFRSGRSGNHRGRRCPVSSVRVACGLLHRLVALSPVMAAPGGSAWAGTCAGSAGRRSSARVMRAATSGLVRVTFAEAIGPHRAGLAGCLFLAAWLIAGIGGRRIGTGIGIGRLSMGQDRRGRAATAIGLKAGENLTTRYATG